MNVRLNEGGYCNEHIEATPIHGNWLFIYWPNNETGRLSKSLIKSLRSIETQMPGLGFVGWLCNSERSHKTMHKLIEKFGAKRYAENDELLFFRKEIINV
jgi:hypothetical protein